MEDQQQTGIVDKDEKDLKCRTCCCALSRRPHKRDGAWSWVVCAAGVLSNIIILGSAYTFGVLFPSLLDDFKGGKAKTALIGSLAVAASGIFGPVAGKLIDRFGFRLVAFFGSLTCALGLLLTSQVPNIVVMYITYSFIFGFGSCCTYNASILVVTRYFDKWLSFSVGLVSAGPGAGVFVISPVVQTLQNAFGWRGAYMGLAALCGIACLLTLTFESNVESNEQDIKKTPQVPDKKSSCTKTKLINLVKIDFSFMRNPLFVICMICAAINTFGKTVPVIHLASYSEELGVSADRTSQLYFYYGLIAMLARVGTGQLCNVKWLSPLALFLTAVLIQSTATLLLPLATSYSALLAYFVVFGIAEGSAATVTHVILISSLLPRQQAQGYGFSMLVICSAWAAGPVFAGFLADISGSYTIPFCVAGSIPILSVLITILFICLKPHETKDSSPGQDDLLVVDTISVV